jgi:hypothetical protein
MKMSKAFWYQIYLPPFLLELASPRAVPPSLLSHLLYVDYLLQFHQVHLVLPRVRLRLRVYHHLQHHHASNKSKRRAGVSARESIQKPISWDESRDL